MPATCGPVVFGFIERWLHYRGGLQCFSAMLGRLAVLETWVLYTVPIMSRFHCTGHCSELLQPLLLLPAVGSDPGVNPGLVFHCLSIVILSIFILEFVLKLIAFRMKFFTHKFEVRIEDST